MTRSYARLLAVTGAFMLSACAQQTGVHEMKRDVRALSQTMSQLNQETLRISQQNALNAKSTHGVYLLPDAQTPAKLESQLGTLDMSLTNVATDVDGMRATLHIQRATADPLPAFSATVAWGIIEGSAERYRETAVKEQRIEAPGSPLVPGNVSLPLRLSGLDPQQPVFVRIHDIEPAAAR